MRIGQALLDHLRDGVLYPATGEQIKRAGDMMAGVPAAERAISIERINSRKLYLSAADVVTDLQSSEGPTAALYGGHPGPYVRFSLAK